MTSLLVVVSRADEIVDEGGRKIERGTTKSLCRTLGGGRTRSGSSFNH